MPLALTCSATLLDSDPPFNSHNYASRLGTAAHEWLADRLRKRDRYFGIYATKHSVDAKELEKLSYKALRLYGEVEDQFPDLQVEYYHSITVDGLTLTGHMDLLSPVPPQRLVVVGDHKTGYLDGDYDDQLKTYGLLALDIYPSAEKVLTIQLNVREYTYDRQVYTRDALQEWLNHRVLPLATTPPAYNPTYMCRFCGHRSYCPGYKATIEKAARILVGDHVGMTPRELYDAYLHFSKLVDETHQYIKDQVYAEGGTMEYDEKFNLSLDSQVLQEVVFTLALPVLQRHLSAEQIASITSVGKGDLETTVKAMHGKGNKGQAWAMVMQELEEAQALNQKINTVLRKRKKS